MASDRRRGSMPVFSARWLYGVLLLLFGLTQWPLLAWANRIEPTLYGVPFLYVYLLVIYLLAIALLIGLARRED